MGINGVGINIGVPQTVVNAATKAKAAQANTKTSDKDGFVSQAQELRPKNQVISPKYYEQLRNYNIPATLVKELESINPNSKDLKGELAAGNNVLRKARSLHQQGKISDKTYKFIQEILKEKARGFIGTELDLNLKLEKLHNKKAFNTKSLNRIRKTEDIKEKERLFKEFQKESAKLNAENDKIKAKNNKIMQAAVIFKN